jgi:hypothetical protein
MLKFSFKKLISTICIAYTILSLSVTGLAVLSRGGISPDQFNLVLQFVWTCIALGSLSLYYFFEDWSTLTIIVLQYVVAISLVCLSLLFIGLFDTLHPDSFKDAFITFTIPYVIGAVIFNISLRRDVQKTNQKLEQLRR